jgi:hypothetical protein
MATRPQDEFDFALKEDDERLVLAGKQLLRRALYDARMELQRRHLDAKNRGEIVTLIPDRAAVASLLLEGAQKALSPGVSD